MVQGVQSQSTRDHPPRISIQTQMQPPVGTHGGAGVPGSPVVVVGAAVQGVSVVSQYEQLPLGVSHPQLPEQSAVLTHFELPGVAPGTQTHSQFPLHAGATVVVVPQSQLGSIVVVVLVVEVVDCPQVGS